MAETAVLVIEDHGDTREPYCAVLAHAGFRCVGVVDGQGLAWRLRALAQPPPLIAVSGYPFDATSPTLFAARFMKPLDTDDLVAAVHRLVAR